ncbi:hypothetical protein [Salinispora fenicalii]|nr:hypothetical protein [Salinispora fenicalii]
MSTEITTNRANVGPVQAVLHANQNQPTNHLGSPATPERRFG